MKEEDLVKKIEEELNDPLTFEDLAHWQDQALLDEWYTENVYDENGNPIDLNLLKEDEDDTPE